MAYNEEQVIYKEIKQIKEIGTLYYTLKDISKKFEEESSGSKESDADIFGNLTRDSVFALGCNLECKVTIGDALIYGNSSKISDQYIEKYFNEEEKKIIISLIKEHKWRIGVDYKLIIMLKKKEGGVGYENQEILDYYSNKAKMLQVVGFTHYTCNIHKSLKDKNSWKIETIAGRETDNKIQIIKGYSKDEIFRGEYCYCYVFANLDSKPPFLSVVGGSSKEKCKSKGAWSIKNERFLVFKGYTNINNSFFRIRREHNLVEKSIVENYLYLQETQHESNIIKFNVNKEEHKRAKVWAKTVKSITEEKDHYMECNILLAKTL